MGCLSYGERGGVMPIVETLNEHTFVNRFSEFRDNFSPKALRELYHYYNDSEFTIEFDPVAICCDWTEYETKQEALEDYSGSIDSWEEFDYKTTVIPIYGDSVLIQNF